MSNRNNKELDIITSRSRGIPKAKVIENDYEDYRVDIEDIYQEERISKRKRKQERKKKRKRKIALLIAELIAIPVLVFALVLLLMPNSKAWLLGTPLGKFLVGIVVSEDDFDNIHDKEFNRSDIEVNDGLDISAMDGYYNIALFGLDSREGELDSGVNSDTIIIASINEETGEVKMCSVYRDTYLRVVKKDGSNSYDKVNSAYCFGGPEETVKTLNANFDLNISDYVSINFGGLANIIDMLGGIDINISSDEAYWINQYLTETRKVTGMYTPDVYSSGNVHLTGLQAVAFCRIRKVTFIDEDGQVYSNDFGRTARQRRVIMKIVELAKNAGVDKVMDVANAIFDSDSDFIKTSIPYDDVLDLIPTLLSFSITGTNGYPYTYECPELVMLSDGSRIDFPVAITGLSYNNYKMHEFLFNDKNYKPSDTVKNIEKTLNSMLGYGEKRLDGDENVNLQ